MFVLYNILLTLAFPVILAVLFAKKRCRPGLRQRLGWLPQGVADECRDGRTIWVHAVSLGEATAAVPLVQAIKARYPTHRIIVSTVTETGREAVLRRLEKQASHLYFPLDYPWVVGRVLDAVRPCAFIFVETEIWPNFLLAAAARGVPTILVNGRLSTDSFQGYLRLRPFFQRVLDTLSLCLMQTDRDVERIIGLGAASERVVRTGNIKFDQDIGPRAFDSSTLTRTGLGLRAQEELFVAGSTHPVEEEEVLDCYRRLLEGAPSLVLVMAPRHIERADELEGVARARGFPVARRTTLPSLAGGAAASPEGARVIILDTRGELAALYREATLVFVGGSLVRVGGHNPLEPAVWGKGVVFGPHMDHFAEVADLLIRQGAGIQVHDAQEMADAMTGLLKDRPRLDLMGKAAAELVLANQGAVARNVELIAGVLGKG
jgi:3-deoxy-D-manno-octulosonic-acid transferase